MDDFKRKYIVEFKEEETDTIWDYVDNHHAIEDAEDEKHAIEIAKEKFMKMYGDEVTAEEVNTWTWRAAEVIGETEYLYITHYDTKEFVYVA